MAALGERWDVQMGTVLFASVSAILFALVGFSLWSGKTLGIAFRSRLFARRQYEPALYWSSLTILAILGLLTLAVALSNLQLMQR